MVIIAAIDRSERAQNVIAEAVSVAKAFDEELHVVYVLPQSEFVALERTSYEDTGEIKNMSEVKELAAEIASTAASSHSQLYEPVGLVGNPKKRIVQYASETDARYIIVGPRKRSPAGKVMFGSTAQSILLNSPCPVISVIIPNSQG